MIYIDPIPNPSGAYPNPKGQPFEGAIPLNGEEAAVFFRYNGFVTLTETGVTPNTEAWEAWKAALPEEEPDPESAEEAATKADVQSVWDAMAAAYKEGVYEA